MKKFISYGSSVLVLVTVLSSMPSLAMAATKSGKPSAQKMWDQMYKSNAPARVDGAFKLNYLDSKSFVDKGDLGFSLKKTTASLEGSGYFDNTNPYLPQTDASFNYSFGTNNMKWGGTLGMKEVNGQIYLKVDGAPQLRDMLDLQPGSDGWVLLPPGETSELPSSELMQGLWQKYNIIKVKKFVGEEQVNGRKAYHFTATVDKSNLKKALTETLKSLDVAVFADDESHLFSYTVGKVVDKIKVKNLDIWLGYDGYISKVHLETSVPSAASFFKLISDDSMDTGSASTSTEIKREINKFLKKLSFSANFTLDVTTTYPASRTVTAPTGAYDLSTAAHDAKRMADVRQMSSALELFFNDYGSYPTTLESLKPSYIYTLPTAPAPPAASCTVASNTYNYVFKNPNEYELHFCLGRATGGYEPGTHVMTPNGIR